MRLAVSAALALGLGCGAALAVRAQEGPVGNKPQLVISADTVKETVPGLEGIQGLPPALLSRVGAQRQFRAQLWTPGSVPGSATASLEVPERLKLGATLPLQLPKPGTSGRVDRAENFALNRYWGSGEGVRTAQPHVYKGRELTGDLVARWYNLRRRGAVGVPDWTEASWPAPGARTPAPAEGATLAGKYQLTGSYVKPLSFDLPADLAFLEPVSLFSSAARQPDLSRPISLSWKPVPGAFGYMAVATAMKGKDVLVVWTSTEKEEDALQPSLATTAGLQDAVDRKLLIGGDKPQCLVPAGVFAGCEGVQLQLIAFGPVFSRVEGNVTVRVQTRSIGTLSLGHAGSGLGGFGGKG